MVQRPPLQKREKEEDKSGGAWNGSAPRPVAADRPAIIVDSERTKLRPVENRRTAVSPAWVDRERAVTRSPSHLGLRRCRGGGIFSAKPLTVWGKPGPGDRSPWRGLTAAGQTGDRGAHGKAAL